MEVFQTPQFFAAVVFFVFIIFYWVYAFVILYHLTRFGVGVQPKKFALFFLIGSALLFFVSVLIFATIDVSATITQITKLLQSFNIKAQ